MWTCLYRLRIGTRGLTLEDMVCIIEKTWISRLSWLLKGRTASKRPVICTDQRICITSRKGSNIRRIIQSEGVTWDVREWELLLRVWRYRCNCDQPAESWHDQSNRSPATTYMVRVETVRLVGSLLRVEQELHHHPQHVTPREAFLRLRRIKVPS